MISYISFYIHLFYITKKNKNITIIENSMTLKYVSLLFLLLVPFTFCDCPITLTPGQVIADSFVATINSLSKTASDKENVYQYSKSLEDELKDLNNLKIAVAIKGFQLQKKQQLMGIGINPLKSKLEKKMLLLQVNIFNQEPQSWKFIVLSFLLSDARELILGIKTVPNLIPNGIPGQIRINETIEFPSNTQTFRLSSKIFISGFQAQIETGSIDKRPAPQVKKAASKLRQASKNKESIKSIINFAEVSNNPKFYVSDSNVSSNGQLSFTISVFAIQLKSITYSYIIYLENTSGDVSYRATLQQFLTVYQPNPQAFAIKNLKLSIYGLSGLSFPPSDKDRIKFSFRFVQMMGKEVATGQVPNANLEALVDYFGIEVVPGARCKSCPNSPYIYKQFCVSECPPGHISTTNIFGSLECQQCNIEKLMISDEEQSRCICADGYFLMMATSSCQKCPYDCLTCYENRCLTCDTPIPSYFRVLNTATGRCECQVINDQGLVFYDNFNDRRCNLCNQRCRSCKGPEIFDCLTCAPLRVLKNGYCRCQENLVQNEDGQCICSSGKQGQPCLLTRSMCGQNQTVVQTGRQFSCLCKPGFTRSYYSNRCLKNCQPSQQFSRSSQRCECLPGQLRHPRTNMCYSCQSKLNQVYNAALSQCECITGYEMNNRGQCIMCGSKMYYNQVKDQCECIFNYYRIGNQCRKCKSSFDGEGCKKISGLVGMNV